MSCLEWLRQETRLEESGRRAQQGKATTSIRSKPRYSKTEVEASRNIRLSEYTVWLGRRVEMASDVWLCTRLAFLSSRAGKKGSLLLAKAITAAVAAVARD